MANEPRNGSGTERGIESDVTLGLSAYARGDYLAAHEAFEHAWRATAASRSLELHALAQWAAAAHKHVQGGKPVAVRAIAERAREKLARLDGGGRHVDVRALERAIGAWLRGGFGPIPQIERASAE